MNLNIAVISLDSVPAAPETNLKKVEEAIHSLPPETDLVVLPELFSTGFLSDEDLIYEFAEPVSGKTMQAIRNLAAENNVAISGSYLALTGKSITNRAFFTEPSGEETFYDKRHLFCGSPEARIMTRGYQQFRPVRYRGWNISMAICYDLRFPVWCRNRNQETDLMIVPANWPAAREYAWQHLLIARAIENQIYVVGANRSGKDDFGTYSDLTFIYDPLGKPVKTEQVSSDTLFASLDRVPLEKLREKFPVSRDADNFSILF